MNPDAIDKDHAAKQTRLVALSRRILWGGLAAAAIGFALALGGLLATPFAGNDLFPVFAVLAVVGWWAFGGGLMAAFVGSILRLVASWGSVLRYQAAETLPVVTDAVRAVRDDLQR